VDWSFVIEEDRNMKRAAMNKAMSTQFFQKAGISWQGYYFWRRS